MAAVGPAGTPMNANVRPQNDGGASSDHVEKFSDAVRSTTPGDTSAAQSSKGKQTPAHSQEASKSFAIILATRPPINFGKPIGKQDAPRSQSQTSRSSSSRQTPSGGAQGAMSGGEEVESSFQEVEELGTRIASSEGPVTDEERAEWMQAQQDLQQSITDYADEISKLPPDSPIARQPCRK